MILIFLVLILIIKFSMRKSLDNKNVNFVLIIFGILSIIIPFIENQYLNRVLKIVESNTYDVWIITAALFIMSCHQLFLMISEPEKTNRTLLTIPFYLGLFALSIESVWVKAFICFLLLIQTHLKNMKNHVIFDLELPLVIMVIMLNVSRVIPQSSIVSASILSILVLHTLLKKNTIEKTFILILLCSISLNNSTSSNEVILYINTFISFVLAMYFLQHKELKLKIIDLLTRNYYAERVLIKLNYKLMGDFIYVNRHKKFKRKAVNQDAVKISFVSADYIRNYLLILVLITFTVILGIEI